MSASQHICNSTIYLRLSVQKFCNAELRRDTNRRLVSEFLYIPILQHLCGSLQQAAIVSDYRCGLQDQSESSGVWWDWPEERARIFLQLLRKTTNNFSIGFSKPWRRQRLTEHNTGPRAVVNAMMNLWVV